MGEGSSIENKSLNASLARSLARARVPSRGSIRSWEDNIHFHKILDASTESTNKYHSFATIRANISS